MPIPRSLIVSCIALGVSVQGNAGRTQERERRDLARFLPPGAHAYVELRQPGAHLARVVEAAGLTRPDGDGQPFFVSPRLLAALKTVEGAAVAVTDLDLRRGMPQGVLVVDPGSADLLYGLVETALAGGAAAGQLRLAESIAGSPTYESPLATVSLAGGIIVAGTSRELVEAALDRARSGALPSLANDPGLAEGRSRAGDSLLTVLVNAAPVIALLKAEAFEGGEPPQEYRLAQALGDVESLRWASLQVGAGERSLSADARVRLADGNNAVAYHLLRTPRVSQSALALVPADAVAFVAFALGDPTLPPHTAAGDPGPVTGLDVGRELFANIKDVAAFVLARPEPAAEPGPGAIPDAALIFTVRDAARSQTLWKQLLSLAALATRAQVKALRVDRAGGREVNVYAFGDSLELYFTTLDDRVVVATSASAVAFAARPAGDLAPGSDAGELAAAAGDPGFAPSKLAIVHVGRLLDLLGPALRWRSQEAQAARAALAAATVSIVTEETPSSLRLRVRASVPRLDELLKQLLARRAASPETRAAKF